MRRFWAVLAFGLVALPLLLNAQTVETARFRALMSSSHETSPANLGIQAMGTATIEFVLKRDSEGVLQSAVVDFRVDHYFGQAEMLVNMHIHRGPEGVSGPVVIPSGFGPAVAAGPGSGSLFRAAEVTDSAELAVVQEVMEKPWVFYVNLHSQSFPGGIVRGQLEPVTDPVKALQPSIDYLNSELDLLGEVIRKIALRLGINPADLPEF